MRTLYDIHCHLLPGVDDGASDMKEAIEALQMEYEQGVRHIIFTPHDSGTDESEKAVLIRERFEEVKRQIEEMNFQQELHTALGAELMYTDSLSERLLSGQALTMAGSSYVLVEFFPEARYQELYQGMRNLIHSGYLPILAHIERYDCLTKELQNLEELKELGCYFQVNANTVTGGPLSRRTRLARRLLKEGIIDFLATDAHGSVHRKPELKIASEWVAHHCRISGAMKILLKNPRAIWENYII